MRRFRGGGPLAGLWRAWSADRRLASAYGHFFMAFLTAAACGKAVAEAPPLAAGPVGSAALRGRVVEAAPVQAIMR